MTETTELHFNNFHKICHIIHTISKIDVRLLDQEGNALLQQVNHFIPSLLENDHNEYLTITKELIHNPANSYYYYTNSFGLEYIAVGLWNNQSFSGSILVGPFISSISVIDLTSDIVSKNQLPVSQRKQLEAFYKSLAVISSHEYQAIGDLVVNMCAYPYIQTTFSASRVQKPSLNKEKLQVNIEENKHIIEYRYKLQKELMNAIAKGDREEVARFSTDTIGALDFSDRIPESPIRSAKNITLVLNTLCRLAAEQGGVHPLYIDNISEKFAILIERAPNLPRLKSINVLMMNEYCDIVKSFSTQNYSSIVKKAVDYIHLNLEKPLTLKEIAATIHVNASHLSRTFKQDTNMTITEYINHKRVEEAKLYLQRGNIPITTVAFMVGFNDVNYFSRVFKKHTTLTPSQYK